MAKELEQAKDAGKAQDVKKPSSVSDAFQMFTQKQDEKAKAKTQKAPAEGEGKETDKSLQQTDTEGKKPAPFPYRLIDEEGNEVPFPMKVDGKEIKETDLSKVLTWAQVGYHGNTRLEEVNLKEKGLEEREKELMTKISELQQSQGVLDNFKKAIEEGRLVINPPGAKADKKADEETIDEDLYSEPALMELKKENISLKKDLKKVTDQMEATNKLLLGKLVSETKDILDADIAKAKEKYPLLSEKEVWDLLAEVDNTGKPKYNVEEAAKLSHGNEGKRFGKFIESNPDFLKKDEEERKKIIAEYLEQKAEAEKAPVSAPSSSGAAQKPSTTPKKPTEYKNMTEAAEAANAWLQKKLAAKAKL